MFTSAVRKAVHERALPFCADDLIAHVVKAYEKLRELVVYLQASRADRPRGKLMPA